MSLSDLAQVTVSVDGAGLKEKGFGTIGLACYHSYWTELSRTVTELSELTDAEVPTKAPLYRMCTVAFAQEPRPESVKILRLTTPYTQVIKLTPIQTAGATYEITIETLTGAKATVSVAAGVDLDATCDALVTAIDALGYAEIDAAPSGGTATYLTITSDPGEICYVSGWDTALIKVEDVTPDPGIASDLDDIVNYDEDFYGLAIDLNARAIIEEAADWAETRTMLAGFNTSDWQAADSAETADIGVTLQDKSYARDLIMFKADATDEYGGVGLLAERFPFDPGAGEGGGTWHGKTIKGCTPDDLTPTEKANLREKNYVVYITTAGINHTLDGKTPSGEFADVTRGIDWIRVRMQERLAALQLTGQRVPFTDKGISRIYSATLAVMSEAVSPAGILSPDPEPVVSVPKAANVSANDKANRVLKNVTATGTLAGAIHLTQVTVNISK